MADPQGSSWSDLILPFAVGAASLGGGFAAGRNPGSGDNPASVFLQVPQLQSLMDYRTGLGEHYKQNAIYQQQMAARQAAAEQRQQEQFDFDRQYKQSTEQRDIARLGLERQQAARKAQGHDLTLNILRQRGIGGLPAPLPAQGQEAFTPPEGLPQVPGVNPTVLQAPTTPLPSAQTGQGATTPAQPIAPTAAQPPRTQGTPSAGDYEESISLSDEGPTIKYSLSERAKNRMTAAELFPNDSQGQRDALLIMSNVKTKDPSMVFDPSNITNLHSQFRQDSTNYVLARDGWRTMQATLQNPSPAGDVALVFNFMKIVEPGSVVRESEQEVVRAARPYLESIGIKLDSILTGQGMNDKQRADLSAKAQAMYGARLQSQHDLEGHYAGIAKRHKLSPEDVVIPYAAEDYKTFFDKQGHFVGRAPMSYEQQDAWTQAAAASKGDLKRAAILYERILKSKGVNFDAPAIDDVYAKAKHELAPSGVQLP